MAENLDVRGGTEARSACVSAAGGGAARGGSSGVGNSLLVLTGKSADPPSLGDGGVFVDIASKSGENSDPRAGRYLLQDVARKLLLKPFSPPPDKPEKKMYPHAVCSCLWGIAQGAEAVEVYYSPARGRARYRGLMTCSSVWACPVCASHITERRAEEIRSALDSLRGRGGSAAFATFTVSHAHEDALETVLAGFLAAFRYLTSKPSYKRLRVRYGVLGFIRVLEVTHGRNGWHVHVHVLYCFSSVLSPAEVQCFEDALYPLWESAAARSGLTMARRYGLEVKKAYGSVEEYLAKFGRGPRWDISREMTKGHIKQGRSIAGLKHLTPWELLAAGGGGDWRCGALFREYVERFSGKAQLYWSPSLRALLLPGAEAATDAELVAEVIADEFLSGKISASEWESIKRAVGRAEVLRLVEVAAGAWDMVGEYLARILIEFPPFVPRKRGALSEGFRAMLVQLRDEQTERNRWRGPLLKVGDVVG